MNTLSLMIQNEFQNTFFVLVSFVFSVSFLGFYFLLKLKKTRMRPLRNLFYIPARKSTTDAIQLGGLPLSLSIILGLSLCIIIPEINQIFSFKQIVILKRAIPISFLVTLYGFLDDRFELRPVVKLIFQVITSASISLAIASTLYSKNSSISFIILFIWNMGVINGANLLDGLDTMSIKLNTVTMIGFCCVALLYSTYEILIPVAIVQATLFSFYFFNNAPSKIHLGEIGGSFLGLISLVVAALIYVHPKNISTINNASLSLMMLSLPMVELGVSFLRRLLNKKNPFRGDRFHVHHILRNYHEMKPTTVTSLMSLVYFSSLIPAIISSKTVPIFVSYLFVVSSLIVSYLLVGSKYWITKDSIRISAKSVFNSLRKKDVTVIDSSKIDNFRLIILDEDIEREIEEIYEDDKAA